jgi:hypothetical protein
MPRHSVRNGSKSRPVDWSVYAHALDLYLSGMLLQQVGNELGVSSSRAGQMVIRAKQQLAFRVFKGIPRPLPDMNGNYHASRPK